jgi:hypothetical protein
MKIKEILNPDFGKAFTNISVAFHHHFPNVEWVDDTDAADYILLYTIGQSEFDKFFTLPQNKVINFQACYLTTDLNPADWQKMWNNSYATVSYYDLPKYSTNPINFIRTPLGAEPGIFYPLLDGTHPLKVFTTGHVLLTECLDMVHDACVASNSVMFHTGEDFKWNKKHYQFLSYMPITSLADYLRKTQYVTGLRTIEGFEMMCVEGAMCGATPIVPDLETYRDFYKDFALFIDMSGNISEQLTAIFNAEYTPLSLETIKYVHDTFSWKKIMLNLYKQLF